MLIKIETKKDKVELLNAIRTGILDTRKVQSLKNFIDDKIELKVADMSDEELDKRITELENKLKK